MKKAKANINGALLRTMLKMPFGIELVSAAYSQKDDNLELILSGESLPVRAVSGKGDLPEINYDPRPTWTVAGISAKEK